MDRRRFLACAAACALPLAPATASDPDDAPDPRRAGSRLDALVRAIPPELDLRNPNTDEDLSVRFFGPDGYDPQAVTRLNILLRDWRARQLRQVDVRLFWALAAIRAAAMREGHDGRILVFSGYRTARTNRLLRERGYGAAPNSFHLRARAVDFAMAGVPTARIDAFARWLEVGGVGHYRGRFVHIDSGDPKRQWRG